MFHTVFRRLAIHTVVIPNPEGLANAGMPNCPRANSLPCMK